MKDQKFKYIFSLRLAGYLMLNGYRILRINHNLQKDNKDVYVFKDEKNIEKAMEEYTRFKNSKETQI